MKRLFLVAFIMFLMGTVPVMASSEKIEGTDISWYYDKYTYNLKFEGAGAIPSYLYEGLEDENGEGVVHDTPWKDYAKSAKYITIGEGITEVGKYCFDDFTNLKRVSIAGSVEKIEDTFPADSSLIISGSQLTVAEAFAYEYGYIFSCKTNYLRGDMNVDENYDATDALEILKVCAGLNPLYGYSADFNEDGKVSTRDALSLLMYVVGVLPREEVSTSYLSTFSTVIGDAGFDVPEFTVLKSYDEYVEYINQFTEVDPEAFSGKTDEILSKLPRESLSKYYTVIAVYLENDSRDSMEQQLINVEYNGWDTTANINLFVPEDAGQGSCATCLFITLYDELGGKGWFKVKTTYENELDGDISGEKSALTKLSAEEFEAGVEIISDYNAYKDFLAVHFMETDEMDVYTEDFFSENVLLAVKDYTNAENCKNLVPRSISEKEGRYMIHMDRFNAETNSEEEKPFVMLIPTSIKNWDKNEFEISYDDYIVSGVGYDMESAQGVSYETGSYRYNDQVRYVFITEYEEYIDYVNDLKGIHYVGTPKRRSMVYGYTEEYFENNSLVILENFSVGSGMTEVYYRNIVENDGLCQIQLEISTPDGMITEDIGYWGIMIPVEGKDWAGKSYELEAIHTVLENPYG